MHRRFPGVPSRRGTEQLRSPTETSCTRERAGIYTLTGEQRLPLRRRRLPGRVSEAPIRQTRARCGAAQGTVLRPQHGPLSRAGERQPRQSSLVRGSDSCNL